MVLQTYSYGNIVTDLVCEIRVSDPHRNRCYRITDVVSQNHGRCVIE
jgi:hypothetical protein